MSRHYTPITDALASYIREVTLPALERGLAKSGRDAKDFPISFSGLVATGDTDAELLVVGLAPAAHGANRTGRACFTVPTGGRNPGVRRPVEKCHTATICAGFSHA